MIGLLLYVSGAVAQTRFYDAIRTFHENGFTYQANVSPAGYVTLFNKAGGRFINTRQTFRDGRLISEEDREISDVTSQTFTSHLARRIVRDAFSAIERSRIRRGDTLSTVLIICSNTGNIKEVHFRFPRNSSYATIPVSTYRRIELELKRQLRFTPSDFGRNMNFIFRGWMTDVTHPQGIPW